MELLARGRVGHYVTQGRGGVFRDAAQRRGENPLRLVQVAARAYPAYFRPALERVAALQNHIVHAVFASIPPERASDTARDFAVQAVLYAKATLTDIFK